MVNAHELGPHYCHHLETPPDPRKKQAADRFRERPMDLSKMSLDAALSAVPILDERPSKSGKGNHRRLERSGDREEVLKAWLVLLFTDALRSRPQFSGKRMRKVLS